MSIRVHALGFPAEWSVATADLLASVAEHKSREVTTRKGRYRVWRSLQGAELWFHDPMPAPPKPTLLRRALTPSSDEIVRPRVTAVTPFHRGLSRCEIKIGRFLTLDRSNPLEGSCLAWLPSPATGGREQVIVLELAPFALHDIRTPPYRTTAQIVCAAHAVWAWPDAAAYNARTPSNRRAQVGTFSPVTEADVPEVRLTYRTSPVTLGLTSGTIRRSIRHLNPITGAPYYWLLLETRRGTFDVIASPEVVSGDISEGHVAQVCGSFLARLEGTTA